MFVLDFDFETEEERDAFVETLSEEEGLCVVPVDEFWATVEVAAFLGFTTFEAANEYVEELYKSAIMEEICHGF